ncbi:hypothetical protein BASA50_004228 [Batrachochytrium salamandrivorans]|uniref:non-specific serine/threonine protein kinase n=1 Tax=Batrachochytrium salamandrivorans TaxID=1357716 RepID=A0ABQ8FGG2_9FUNG|nr:hypothetical protein BASA62_008457 [Batrachochytrium salamandrivorans]KAH6571110.1 hypothetical protein BASA60_007322 [Batrachochytrium salamandrivorans]KAH6581285.1 hypothetical protein BASA61_009156 [Batrachochytrium salamandrivorans]KAH6597792.1 hypothetical protein BASA50_004228 [Batrachochytrium salamandrivorans]
MISLYGLFILLLTAGTIHAQGNTNDGDGVDQASVSNPNPKDATSLLQRVHPLRLKRPLQESNIPDQNDASSSADPQPKKVCKGGHGIRKLSSPCPQQQSSSEPQPSTLYGSPQSDEMSLPIRVGKSEEKSYRQGQNADQYNAFTKEETEYFELEYSCKKILGQGSFGVVFLATKESNGMEVAYKSISKKNVKKYALESNPPPRCRFINPLDLSEEPSVEQCTSSRPSNLLLPYEFALQMYLSRPGHNNPYVPMVFDYFILEKEYILVMDYLDESWMTLYRYLIKRGRLDIEHARDIIREIVNAMINLKQQGVLHMDIHSMYQ